MRLLWLVFHAHAPASAGRSGDSTPRVFFDVDHGIPRPGHLEEASSASPRLACSKADEATRAVVSSHGTWRALAPCLLECEACERRVVVPDRWDTPDETYSPDQRPLLKRLERAWNRSVSSQQRPVIFFGDSLFGLDAADRESRNGLCRGRREPCATAGARFDTWRMALARAWAVCAARPRLVFLLLGSNDLLNGASTEDVGASAAFAVSYLRACSSAPRPEIILVGLPL